MDSESDWDNCSIFSSISQSSFDDCDASLYSQPSVDYGWESDYSFYCPCCRPLPRDFQLAEKFEQDDNYISWKFAPYRDLRSAARSRRRLRQDRPLCRSYKSRKQEQAYADRLNTKKKREIERFALLESQKESIAWITGGGVARYATVEFDISERQEFDDEIAYMHDVERYSIFKQNADVFESTEPYVEVGENFSTWCQRRIGEMRSVKEARLQNSSPSTVSPMIWQTKRDGGYTRSYNVYTGDAKSTTLPTNAYDALGHHLLRSILAINRATGKKSLLHPILGYQWFGEYEWVWYRTAEGRWRIDYGRRYIWRSCEHVPPDKCPYCRGEEEKMVDECCCGGSGVRPEPEEVQRCSLVEWVGFEGKEIMRREE